MKKFTIALFIALIILLVGGAVYFYIFVPLTQDKNVKPCETINWNPPELTFAVSYCQGDMCGTICDENGENCRTVTTKEECEKIDVVSGSDVSNGGRDGKPDCEWAEADSRCRPNK